MGKGGGGMGNRHSTGVGEGGERHCLVPRYEIWFQLAQWLQRCPLKVCI